MYEEQIKRLLDAIKIKRTKSRYSQKHMADELSISQNMYSKIELGKTQITVCKYLLICDLLEIDPALLIKSSEIYA